MDIVKLMGVLRFPHPSLFKVCEKVTSFDDDLKLELESMWITMKIQKGIGLAANQVGLNKRMFVMEGPRENKLFLVNPYITERSAFYYIFKEGCLSVPGEFIYIGDRSSWVGVTYQDENGESHRRNFTDTHSVCVQHEIDHLDGKSFLESKTIPRNIRKDLAQRWGFKI